MPSVKELCDRYSKIAGRELWLEISETTNAIAWRWEIGRNPGQTWRAGYAHNRSDAGFHADRALAALAEACKKWRKICHAGSGAERFEIDGTVYSIYELREALKDKTRLDWALKHIHAIRRYDTGGLYIVGRTADHLDGRSAIDSAIDAAMEAGK